MRTFTFIARLLTCVCVWRCCYCHDVSARPGQLAKGCRVTIRGPSSNTDVHTLTTVPGIPTVCDDDGDTIELSIISRISDDENHENQCDKSGLPSNRLRWFRGLNLQADLLREPSTNARVYYGFVCKAGNAKEPSRLLSQVLFCYLCPELQANTIMATPSLELLPLPLPASASPWSAHYAVSLSGVISELLAHQVDSPEADDATRGFSSDKSMLGYSESSYIQHAGEEPELRIGVVRVSSICKADGVRCLHMQPKYTDELFSSPSLQAMRHSKRDYNEIIDAVDLNIADKDNEDQRTNDIDNETPIDIQTTEILISASQPTSLPTSQPSPIQPYTSATEGEAQNTVASFKPNFMQDPQIRKLFRSLAIVGLIICVKWLVIKYIQTTTAYRRRRADLLSQTEERGRRRRYRNAARRYRLNMWVRRQVRRVGVPGQRRNENGHNQGQGHGDAGGTADVASSANNRSHHHNHPITNGTSSLRTHSTRPPLMEDELLGFRRVLEYVGELVRGEIIYDSDSLSPTPSMDLEMGYGSDISMFEYNSDGANGETNGSNGGGDARRLRRNELMDIAWEYGYGPGRFATPPPSSIAQLTTFSSPRTSDEGSEGDDGGTPRVSVGSDSGASDDGSSTTGVDGDSEGRNERRDSGEVDLANMSVNDEGREETDMLIARAENIMAK